jgi:uncharacterized C2H2 Zn-finger protein
MNKLLIAVVGKPSLNFVKCNECGRVYRRVKS